MFNKIVLFLEGKLGSPTITEKEGFIHYAFKDGFQQDLNIYSRIFKYHGYSGEETIKAIKATTPYHAQFGLEVYQFPRMTNRFLCVMYDTKEDKIAVSNFATGYDFAFHKKRFYPVRKKDHVLTYTKKIYTFTRRARANNAVQPGKGVRLAKGCNVSDKLEKCTHLAEIKQIMMGIDYAPEINETCEKFLGTTSNYDVIEKVHKIKLPKVLCGFEPKELHRLISVLRDKNELTQLCMYIKSGKKKEYEAHDLMLLLTHMMFAGSDLRYNYNHEVYLIRDYIDGCIKLKKTMSIKMKSLKRVKEEHQRMSREIMLMGIKEFKVHEDYINMFKDFPIQAELIQDKKRLLQESWDLEHCVGTYHGQINKGSCCIISIPWEGEQYTLQVSRDVYALGPLKDKHGFKMVQLRGQRNKSAPAELTKLIDEHFAKNKNYSQVVIQAEGVFEPVEPFW